MVTPHFPRALLREQSHSWNLVGTATTPGTTTQSVAPYVRSDGGGFWSCSMTDVSLSGRTGSNLKDKQRIKVATLLWRAVRQIADGGVNAIVVPRNDALFRPWPCGLSQQTGLDVTHSDRTHFSDTSGYYQSVIDIAASAAALRATSLDITINYAGELMGGESFSIHHPTMGWRLYEIATIDGEPSSSMATITFNPPLRESVTSGTVLEFDRPRCVMRLAATNSMDLSVAPWTFNTASVSFIEAPPQATS